MRIISHRGNIKGPDPSTENTPEKIDYVLNLGYDVEIDIWFKDNDFYLGHDTPNILIPGTFLLNRSKFLWVHCKDITSLNKIRFWDLNFFYHENDTVTLTSNRFIWSYPGVPEYFPNQVCLNFSEDVDFNFYKNKKIYGLCVDYVKE